MRAILTALFVSLSLSPAVFAQAVQIRDATARVAMASAQSGAVFMTLVNDTTADDRLVSVESDVAVKAELHSHILSADGVMQMIEQEAGFVVPAGGSHALARGGDHIMLMGLTRPLAQGDAFTLTLTFEKAGKVVVVVTVGDGSAESHEGHGTAHGAEDHGNHGNHGNQGTATE